jgi:drug/metabolite transporter (DMT)-like permease
MDRKHAVTLLWLLLAVLVWGSSFAATKVALAEVAPDVVVWLRFAIGVVVLASVLVARRQWRMPSGRELIVYAALGLQGVTLHQWLQSNALRTTHASTGGWIAAATPALIALVGALLLRERLPLAGWVGIALAAAGVMVVVTRGDALSLLHGQLSEPGDVLMLLSAPNWAFFSIFSRRALRGQSAARVVFFVMLLGWLGSSAHSLFTGNLAQIPALGAHGWTAVLFLGIFCSGLAYVFWYDALAILPAGQRFNLLTILGGLVILGGVWLVNRSEPAKPACDPEAL